MATNIQVASKQQAEQLYLLILASATRRRRVDKIAETIAWFKEYVERGASPMGEDGGLGQDLTNLIVSQVEFGVQEGKCRTLNVPHETVKQVARVDIYHSDTVNFVDAEGNRL